MTILRNSEIHWALQQRGFIITGMPDFEGVSERQFFQRLVQGLNNSQLKSVTLEQVNARYLPLYLDCFMSRPEIEITLIRIDDAVMVALQNCYASGRYIGRYPRLGVGIDSEWNAKLIRAAQKLGQERSVTNINQAAVSQPRPPAIRQTVSVLPDVLPQIQPVRVPKPGPQRLCHRIGNIEYYPRKKFNGIESMIARLETDEALVAYGAPNIKPDALRKLLVEQRVHNLILKNVSPDFIRYLIQFIHREKQYEVALSGLNVEAAEVVRDGFGQKYNVDSLLIADVSAEVATILSTWLIKQNIAKLSLSNMSVSAVKIFAETLPQLKNTAVLAFPDLALDGVQILLGNLPHHVHVLRLVSCSETVLQYVYQQVKQGLSVGITVDSNIDKTWQQNFAKLLLSRQRGVTLGSANMDIVVDNPALVPTVAEEDRAVDILTTWSKINSPAVSPAKEPPNSAQDTNFVAVTPSSSRVSSAEQDKSAGADMVGVLVAETPSSGLDNVYTAEEDIPINHPVSASSQAAPSTTVVSVRTPAKFNDSDDIELTIGVEILLGPIQPHVIDLSAPPVLMPDDKKCLLFRRSDRDEVENYDNNLDYLQENSENNFWVEHIIFDRIFGDELESIMPIINKCRELKALTFHKCAVVTGLRNLDIGHKVMICFDAAEIHNVTVGGDCFDHASGVIIKNHHKPRVLRDIARDLNAYNGLQLLGFHGLSDDDMVNLKGIALDKYHLVVLSKLSSETISNLLGNILVGNQKQPNLLLYSDDEPSKNLVQERCGEANCVIRVEPQIAAPDIVRYSSYSKVIPKLRVNSEYVADSDEDNDSPNRPNNKRKRKWREMGEKKMRQMITDELKFEQKFEIDTDLERQHDGDYSYCKSQSETDDDDNHSEASGHEHDEDSDASQVSNMSN